MIKVIIIIAILVVLGIIYSQAERKSDNSVVSTDSKGEDLEYKIEPEESIEEGQQKQQDKESIDLDKLDRFE